MPEINNPTDDWIDVYAATGIPVGTNILIQNKKVPYALVLEGAVNPGASNRTGSMLFMPNQFEVDAGSPGVWYRCFEGALAFVQVK